jgi:hypothetical protein
MRSYIDTVFFRGDSIWPNSYFRCMIFPFYHNHSADSANTGVGMIENLPTRYINFIDDQFNTPQMPGYGWKTSAVFVQNTGLYSLERFSLSRSLAFSDPIFRWVNLISFNNKNYKLPVENGRTAGRRAPSNQAVQRLIFNGHVRALSSGLMHNINGRTVRKTSGISRGVYVREN